MKLHGAGGGLLFCNNGDPPWPRVEEGPPQIDLQLVLMAVCSICSPAVPSGGGQAHKQQVLMTLTLVVHRHGHRVTVCWCLACRAVLHGVNLL